jgi:hypothetical protein
MTFVCEYCEREFKRESAFQKHSCKEKERSLFLKTFDGRRAYMFYELWMKAYGRSVPTMEVFATSQFFNAFSKFADYVNRTNLYAPEQFIKLMKEYDVSPTLWLNQEIYEIYYTWVDCRMNALDQVQSSVDTIFKLMEIFGLSDATSAVKRLHSRELIELLRNRKISVYLVLCSSVFKSVIAEMDEGDRKEIMSMINVDYISKKFDGDKKLHNDVKSIVSALGL